MRKAGAACASIAALATGAGAAIAGEPLAPLAITQASVDAQRHPLVSWAPTWPLVNTTVTTRPVRREDGTPARRYQAQGGFMGSLPPETSWRGDDPLIPGVYHVAISGDAAFQQSPFTPFKRIEVKAKSGEWTGPTSQKRYIRLTHPGPRVLDGVSFSVWGGGVGSCYASFVLPRIRVRADGRFSAHVPNAKSRQTGGDVRISGRVRNRFARSRAARPPWCTGARVAASSTRSRNSPRRATPRVPP